MAEAERARTGARYQLGFQELVERRQRRRVDQARSRRGELGRERLGRHRAAPRERERFRREPHQLVVEHVDHRVRHRRGLARPADQRVEEERVAAAALVDRVAPPRRHAAQQRLGLSPRQRAERDALAAPQRAQETRRRLRRAECHDDEQLAPHRAAGEVGEQLDRRGIGPVRVVDHEEHRTPIGHPLRPRTDGSVQPVALPRQVAAGDVEPRRVRERRERDLRLELGRGAAQDGPVGGTRAQLVEQARLADPRLAGELDDAAPAGEQAQFSLTPDQTHA